MQPDDWTVSAIMAIGKIALPTFVLASGIMLGHQMEIRQSQFMIFRRHLLDRAVFLATIGHILMALSMTAKSGFREAMIHGYITDALAFFVISNLFLIPRTSMRIRLALGILLCLGNWITWLSWAPTDPFLTLIRSTLIGPSSEENAIISNPLLPWLGLYLIGSSLGKWLSRFQPQDLWIAGKRLKTVSLVVLAMAIGFKAGFMLVRDFAGWSLSSNWYLHVSPYQKYPPGPFYLLLYGGIALLLISQLLSEQQPLWIRRVATSLRPIGRNSLLVFLFQSFLYYTVFFLLMKETELITPFVSLTCFLPLSLLAVWAFAKLCDHFGAMRLLTTGVPLLLDKLPEFIKKNTGAGFTDIHSSENHRHP